MEVYSLSLSTLSTESLGLLRQLQVLGDSGSFCPFALPASPGASIFVIWDDYPAPSMMTTIQQSKWGEGGGENMSHLFNDPKKVHSAMVKHHWWELCYTGTGGRLEMWPSAEQLCAQLHQHGAPKGEWASASLGKRRGPRRIYKTVRFEHVF